MSYANQKAPTDCPHCSSVNIKYFDKKGYWRCQDCDEAFAADTAVGAASAVIHPQKIFISYPHQPAEHVELVKEIYRRLQARGHLPWMDENEITTGTEWRERITDGILKSDWVIACLSAHSVRDPGVCLNELGIALNQKAGDDALRTVLLENEETSRPPMSLTHIQWLDLTRFLVQRPKDQSDDQQRKNWDAWLDAEIGKLIASIESRKPIAGDIAELTQWLTPAGFIGEIAAKTGNFTGRKWLFEKIEQWRRYQRAQRILWIKGPPGIGKSAVAAQLAHRERSTVLGIHFCKWNDATTHSAAQLVRTMAFQIASRHSDYRELLLNIIKQKFPGDRLREATWQELFRELIANPLAPQRMVIDAGRDRHVIVIDGLDEARDPQGKNEILDLVADELPKLPEWLGVIITSRPEQDIIARLANPFELDTDSEENRADVEAYLFQGLGQRAGDDNRADLLATAVELAAERAEGNMLYAAELLRAVDSGNLDPYQPNSFPVGLPGIYYNNLKRSCPDLDTYHRTPELLLGLIVACPVALPEKLAMAVLGVGLAEFNSASSSLSTLLTRRGSHNEASLELFHKSLGEWLVNPEHPHAYQIDSSGTYRLADFLWNDYQAAMKGHAANETGISAILFRKMKWHRCFSIDGDYSPRYWLNLLNDLARATAQKERDLRLELEYARRTVALTAQAYGTAHDLFEVALDEFNELKRQFDGAATEQSLHQGG